jgi:hypothetical protein
VILNGAGSTASIQERVELLKAQMEGETSDYAKEQIQKRIGSRVIAETNRRHLASNKLAKRTSKKVAGACERWPSWSLFSGATRGEGPAKRCPEAPLRGEQCPGVSRGSGPVLQALAGGWRIAR